MPMNKRFEAIKAAILLQKFFDLVSGVGPLSTYPIDEKSIEYFVARHL